MSGMPKSHSRGSCTCKPSADPLHSHQFPASDAYFKNKQVIYYFNAHCLHLLKKQIKMLETL